MTGTAPTNAACFTPALALTVALGLVFAPATPALSQTVRDSAGIRIVDNRGPLSQSGWRVSSTPVTVIGRLDGRDGTSFENISSAVILSDGSVAVGDQGASQVKVFDASGMFVAAAGRRGGGPREFQMLVGPFRCRGSVFVRDPLNRQFVELAIDGRLVDSTPHVVPERWNRPASQLSCNRKGGILHIGRQIASVGTRPGPWRTTAHIVMTDMTGSIAHDFGRWPGEERQRFGSSDGPRPLGKVVVAALSDRFALYGGGDGPELSIFDVESGRRTIVRWAQQPRSFTSADQRAYTQQLYSRNPQNREAVDRYLRQQFEPPTVLPPYSAALVDPSGNFWVEEYPRPGSTSTTLRVISAEGTWLANVRVPVRMSTLDVTANSIVGRVTDQFGVQYLHIFRYQR